MNKKISLLCLFSAIFFVTLQSQSQTTIATHFIIARQCLANALRPYTTLAVSDNLVFIKVDDNNLKQAVKSAADDSCGKFMEVSDAWETYQKNNSAIPNADQANKFLATYLNNFSDNSINNYQIRYQKEVNQLYSMFNSENMWTYLKYFTDTSNFPDRFAAFDDGVNAQHWIENQVRGMISAYHRESDVNVSVVSTNEKYKQSSIVVKLGSQLSTPGIVLGAHMDTPSQFNGDILLHSVKPGADDDGSGVVTLLEILRSMLASGMTFNKPIYFVWYAAHEVGLIGSQQVVQYFKNQQIPVDAVLNLDMTGYSYQNDPTIWLVRDQTDCGLNVYLEQIIKTYINRPIQYTECGYACSDHASWTQQGYKAVFPTEGRLDKEGYVNPYVHWTRDRIDNLSVDRMTDFAKVTIAFTVELAQPVAHEVIE